jgi:MFS superfamily sulfate permease-like transporter
MTLFTSIIYGIVLGFVLLIMILIFGMAQAAGQADELSERIYKKEMEKLERNKQLMEEANKNPEYISPEDK